MADVRVLSLYVRLIVVISNNQTLPSDIVRKGDILCPSRLADSYSALSSYLISGRRPYKLRQKPLFGTNLLYRWLFTSLSLVSLDDLR